ncbi:MAG TPA: ABC transporter substrate binding protein [Candidatus Deferrimicrobiaceae bacterium]
MRALRNTFLALALLAALPAWGADVLVVQSGRSAAYEESLRGFQAVYKGTVQTVVLSDYAEVDVVRLVNEEHPRLVLAVGDAAIGASRKVGQVPVVGLLSLSLNLAKAPAGPFSAVGMLPPPERYLELCQRLGAKRVGVIHDPARTGQYLKRARQAARPLGIELVVREVHTPPDTIARLEQLEGAVDALWMLPDATAVTSATLDAWFLFSLRQKVPVVTFSEQYLARGAAVSLDVDRTDLGHQAGELANALLTRAASPPVSLDARKVQAHGNPTVGRNLGIDLSTIVK